MVRDYVREVTENLEAWLGGKIGQEDFEAERDRIASTLPDGSTVYSTIREQDLVEVSDEYEYA